MAKTRVVGGGRPRGAWVRRLGVVLGVCALATAPWACHREEWSLQRVAAWIGQDPPLPFPPEGAEHSIVEREVALAGLGAAAGWLTADLELQPQPEALRVLARGSDPRMSRAVEFDAAQVTLVSLEGCAETAWPAQLHWAREGEQINHHNRMVAEEAGPCRQLFRVGKHPAWNGKIRRLLLKPVPEGGAGQLVLLRAYRPARAEDWQHPFQVDLAGDLRLSRVVKAAQPFRQPFRVPAAGLVRTACGPTSPLEPQGCVWRLRQGPEVLLAGELPSAAGWQKLELDLAPWEGRELELEIAPKVESVPLAVAHPELLARQVGARPPNIIVISVDTLRADHLSLYGYPRSTSPAIDAWAARRGVVFEQAVAAAPWTLPSHTTLLSGLEALRHGVNYSDPVPERIDLLAEKLRRQGYRTLAWTGGAFLAPHFGLVQGFEAYRYPRRATPEQMEAGKDLEANLDSALATLATPSAPFFLFLHTYNVHAPFVSEPPPPEPLRAELARALAERGLSRAQLVLHSKPGEWVLTEKPGEFRIVPAQGADAELGRLMYDAGIARTDALLARLFTFLEQSGLEADTVVVLTSDHGEALGEHQLTGHDALYDINLMVPLVIARPDGRDAGRRQKAQVRQSDVVPTILELAGLPAEPELDGHSLVPLLGGAAPAEFPKLAVAYGASNNRGLALRWQGRLKWITPNSLLPGPVPTPELYDLRADPGEQHNLASSGAEPRAESLRREAHTLYEAAYCPWRFEITNPSPDGRLMSRWIGAKVSRFRLKTLDEPIAGKFEHPASQILDVTLEPGGRARFCLETLYPAPLALEMRFSPAHGAPTEGKWALDLQAEGTRHWRLAGARWEEAVGRLAEAGIGVQVEARATQLPAGLPAMDAELRRQLESLGYVD